MTPTDPRGRSRPADARWERWGASSGFAVLVVSAGAVAFERGAPSPGASTAEITDFLADHRGTLVAQSLLFVVGAGILLWFLGSLRSYLLGAEGGTGRLSAVVYGAGVAGTAVNVVAQAFQVGVAAGSTDDVPVALFATMGAVFAVANLPLAVMLAAVAVLSFRAGASRPGWAGCPPLPPPPRRRWRWPWQPDWSDGARWLAEHRALLGLRDLAGGHHDGDDPTAGMSATRSHRLHCRGRGCDRARVPADGRGPFGPVASLAAT